MKSLSTILLASNALLGSCHSFAHDGTPQSDTAQIIKKCTSSPCSNTPTGEEPRDVAVKQGQQVRDAILATAPDKERWNVRIYSDSNRNEDLEIVLLKKAQSRLRLLPKLGQIQFVFPYTIDTFEIETPAGDARAICPRYALEVVDASTTHTVFEKMCFKHEYKPNRYSMTATYYLYDNSCHTMRTIWNWGVDQKDDQFPQPDSAPKIKVLKNGYDLRWNTTFVDGKKPEKLTMHNVYSREILSNDRQTLGCADMTLPKDERSESGWCEGAVVPLISSVRQSK
jgi:hypothetical protein